MCLNSILYEAASHVVSTTSCTKFCNVCNNDMTQCNILLRTSCMNLCLITLNIKATKHLWGEVMIYCMYMRASVCGPPRNNWCSPLMVMLVCPLFSQVLNARCMTIKCIVMKVGKKSQVVLNEEDHLK